MPETVEIERLCYGPDAIAHSSSGKTIFVAGGAAGDRAEIEITDERKTFSYARIAKLIQPAPSRIEPPCTANGACGGCPWQHIGYQEQLRAKEANVLDALVRIGGFSEEEAREKLRPIIASPQDWGYRNKLELQVQTSASGLQLGMHAHEDAGFVPCSSCLLAHKEVQKSPKALQGALRFLSQGKDLGLFRVGVRHSQRTKETELALWTTPGPFPRAAAAKTLGSAVDATSIVRIVSEPGKRRPIKGVEALAGKGHWTERLAGCRFRTSAPSFFQVNTPQAETLVYEALSALAQGLGVEPQKAPTLPDFDGLHIADLYSGGGTFSLPLAWSGAQVTAVEYAGSSVRDLERNAKGNKADIRVIGGDALRELAQLKGLDALIVDPPQAGLGDAAVQVLGSTPLRCMVYVSCNPTTLARDIKRLQSCGFQLAFATPIDLFPQTYHVETVALLSKK